MSVLIPNLIILFINRTIEVHNLILFYPKIRNKMNSFFSFLTTYPISNYYYFWVLGFAVYQKSIGLANDFYKSTIPTKKPVTMTENIRFLIGKQIDENYRLLLLLLFYIMLRDFINFIASDSCNNYNELNAFLMHHSF